MGPRRFLLPGVLVLLATMIRLIPYILNAMGLVDISNPNGMPWNVSPIGALCLFGGAQIADRRLAFAVPLLSLILSDLGIALLMGDITFGLHPMIPVVYGCFGLMVLLGMWLRKSQSGLATRILSLCGAAVAGEVVFFVLTNFANWIAQTEYYPHTMTGLITCYDKAIPFFMKSLTGMFVYGTALFAGYAWLFSRETEARPVALESR
jgi:hypothetical protein